MMGFSLYQKPRGENLKIPRSYTLYRDGLFKTCNRDTALGLLKTGNWHDKTNYKPNEEVLNYERQRQLRLRLRNVCGQSETSSERQEPGHQQYQLDSENSSGTKHCGETIRTGQTNCEVKKRGRPKKAVK